MDSAPEQTIILVYEHDSIRRKLARTLMAEGYRVFAYSSVDAFLDSLPEAAPTCIVLGVPSEEFTGQDLVDQLLFLCADNALVTVTVDSELAGALRVASRGQFTVVQIPIETDLLVAAVRRAFAHADPSRPGANGRSRESAYRFRDD